MNRLSSRYCNRDARGVAPVVQHVHARLEGRASIQKETIQVRDAERFKMAAKYRPGIALAPSRHYVRGVSVQHRLV